jgi:hypothetical protein
MRHVFEWLDNLDPMAVVLVIAIVLMFLYVIERRRR